MNRWSYKRRDWDDNGVWRVLHKPHLECGSRSAAHRFNNLNKLNYDATVVLGF